MKYPHKLPEHRTRTAEKTAESKRRMLKALMQNAFAVTPACKQAGIDRSTHYRWLDTDKEYEQAVKDTRLDMLDKVENALFRNAINNDNVIAQKFILERLHPEYKKRDELEVNHDGLVIEILPPKRPDFETHDDD